jgi:hypothetical protein
MSNSDEKIEIPDWIINELPILDPLKRLKDVEDKSYEDYRYQIGQLYAAIDDKKSECEYYKAKLEAENRRNIELEQVVKDIGNMWRKTCNGFRGERDEAHAQAATMTKARDNLQDTLDRYIKSFRDLTNLKESQFGKIDQLEYQANVMREALEEVKGCLEMDEDRNWVKIEIIDKALRSTPEAGRVQGLVEALECIQQDCDLAREESQGKWYKCEEWLSHIKETARIAMEKWRGES